MKKEIFVGFTVSAGNVYFISHINTQAYLSILETMYTDRIFQQELRSSSQDTYIPFLITAANAGREENL